MNLQDSNVKCKPPNFPRPDQIRAWRYAARRALPDRHRITIALDVIVALGDTDDFLQVKAAIDRLDPTQRKTIYGYFRAAIEEGITRPMAAPVIKSAGTRRGGHWQQAGFVADRVLAHVATDKDGRAA